MSKVFTQTFSLNEKYTLYFVSFENYDIV